MSFARHFQVFYGNAEVVAGMAETDAVEGVIEMGAEIVASGVGVCKSV